MLSTKVIATHITNLTDARYFAAWGVDYLAYITDSGRDESVSLAALQEIDGWVEGPATLLMYEGVSIDAESKMYQEAGYRNVILGPYIEDEGEWSEVFRIVTALDTEVCSTPGKYIYRPESTIPDSIDIVEGVQIYIDADMSTEKLKQVSAYDYITGIVVRGSEEQKVGIKSFDELTDLFESLEVF